ncbi:MAG: dihydroorotate dehydrogenase [Treponema sp.]|nr:dihydroorotate dehydrogenase [Treponema sp.]
MFDKPQIDKDGNGILFNGEGLVECCKPVEGQKNVFLLETVIELERPTQVVPEPGQFYMLRTKVSSGYFKRPISVYHAEEYKDGKRKLKIQFLILEKGVGTRELCALKAGETFLLSGPVGNSFIIPDNVDNSKTEICIVGGGIGIAPVANFASSLPDKSYDFFASFKTGSYGLEYVKGNELIITTDDGSKGIKGMLPEALTAERIKKSGYKVIYACGPTPMLAYIQKIAAECNVKAYLSVEHHMLCGAGACLGCTIVTKKGTLRVCKEGPVFDSEILDFGRPPVRRTPLAEGDEPDVSVDIAGVHFENPVFAAAGTFGYGQNFRGFSDVNDWGAICSKGTTLNPREGNAGERCIEVPSGDINSIGLQNPGMQYAVNELIPDMMKLKPKTIINLAGSDLESYVEATKLADTTDAPMIELNISCPNVKAGGQAWGIKSELAFECVSAVRKATKKALMVKLSPNAPDLRGVAMACVKAGADALSLVNTFQAVSIDIENETPWFNNIRAGLCGPAIKPLALRMVYDVVEEMNKLPEEQRIPVIGIGGISTWQDAVEFIMAGACAVQIGTATFVNPNVAKEVVEGLKNFMKRKGFKTISQMCGIAQKK